MKPHELAHMTAMRENVEKENWERYEKMNRLESELTKLKERKEK